MTLEHSLQKRIDRFPNFFAAEMKSFALRSLAHSEEFFCAERTPSQLTRIAARHFYLRELLKQKEKGKKTLLIKCFPSKIHGKKSLSLCFALTLSHSHEILEEKHVFKALSRFLPGIKTIVGSFYSFFEKKTEILFCYLEIEKPWGNPLSYKEIHLLHELLPSELIQSVQSLVPALLFPYNEEELYKSAVQLAKEIKGEKDLPQVMISFQSQNQETLSFHVVIARRKKGLLSFSNIPSSLRLHVQKTFSLGSRKEILILYVDVDNHLFFRKNWSIDLKKGRLYVVKGLEQVIGTFRDYNGGLFSAQNKQLEEIKKNLKDRHPELYPVIEDIFYAFFPSIFQALISIRIARYLFSLFVFLLKEKLPDEKFLIRKRVGVHGSALVIKTDDLVKTEFFLKKAKELSLQGHSCFGYSSIEYEGVNYLFLVDLNSNSLFDDFEQNLLLDEPPKKRKVLRLNFQEGDPPSLNPHLAGDIRSRSLGRALFEGLTRLNPKGVPVLASALDVKITGTLYTFTLRESYWSNGEKVTAYDFERAWKKALHSHSDCLRVELFYIIKNAKKAHEGLLPLQQVKIKAQNETTLLVELEHPSTQFLHLVAHPLFSPLFRGEEEPTSFNGPFIIKEWKRDQEIQLTSNSYYWDRKHVTLQDVVITMVKDMSVVSRLFVEGKLDWIGDPFSLLPPQPTSSWITTPLKTKKVDRAYWIYLNTHSFPLNSAHIRKALAFAFNRKDLIEKLFGGDVPQVSPILETKFKKECLFKDGNVSLAKHHFELGLKELNVTKEDFPEITFHYSDVPGQGKLASAIQKEIESILGIKMNVVEIDWTSLSNQLDKKEYQLAGCCLASPQFGPSQWKNNTYQLLSESAERETDKKIREKILKKAEHILLEEMPVIPVLRPSYKYLLGERIKKVSVAKDGEVDLKWVTL